MDEHHLSQRLSRVAAYVQPGSRVADIGADHAYLASALVLEKKSDYVVAGEVVKGPYQNAVDEVQAQGLTGQVHVRLADGLAAIGPADRVDTLTIAGMGGSLITQILDSGQDKLAGVKRLILQPNVGEERLRQWLVNHRFQINAEEILAEDGHTYEIIVAEPTIIPIQYDERELVFGPLLIERQGTVFEQKWQEVYQREAVALTQMKAATTPPVDKIRQFEHRLALIKEVIG
ncbi:MAG TPA: tRNA (adenine(22)-N(1))-methyltransferase TrmK [Candidatus Limosilactobacillus merdipullorum]|uniref:tRNA (Adenine(22)-N(1))-methyltransferase TrmK n=1 Tax=Candidatus Limosilactobacillus merdipullorum TaxID=2838653 RepID=A0A9D1U3K4_9LACO|nr:tRNA (adenine(22)-N(1))-methyltransferase TrmK [Candidatus Limosilactobacillus merdipullorum]